MTLSTPTPTAPITAPAAGPDGQQHPAPPSGPSAPDVPHAVYVFDVDEVTYEFDHPTITGARVMAAAGIPESEGIIQLHEDGTRDTITATTVIQLVSGGHFKRRPRFKRG
jgi:hypothetical protein